MTTSIVTAVFTDTMGNYQARCFKCTWRGRWCRSETAAASAMHRHALTRHDTSWPTTQEAQS